MRKQKRTVIASLVAAVGVFATTIPANAFSFLMPTRYSMKTIERLAPYVPQSKCDPAAKIGTRSVLALLERKYPGTGSDGISRACNSGGRSEHKEGRALDWAVNYYNGTQRAQAANAINWLLKKDRLGRPYANARRLGVMYIIWNRKIWTSSHPGWNAYNGASQHRDHMHISLSWSGALAKTSFWTGKTKIAEIKPVTVTPAPNLTPSTAATTSPAPAATTAVAPTAGSSPTGSTLVTSTDEQKKPWWTERE